jgi:hypothetical protein
MIIYLFTVQKIDFLVHPDPKGQPDKVLAGCKKINLLPLGSRVKKLIFS